MKNNWSKKIAKNYIKRYKKLGFSEDLALRVYTTRLLGRNKELVLHGGGNTSVKTTIKANNKVKTYWGDAFESIKKVKDAKYDKIFVDLNDDQFCINLAAKNMKGLKRILKPGGIITAQVGCMSKKPKQVKNWMELLKTNFGNVELKEVFIPSFDCRWNFASSTHK